MQRVAIGLFVLLHAASWDSCSAVEQADGARRKRFLSSSMQC